jgi:hypothetical protein
MYKKMISNKKAQFYIFTAIIFSAYAFMIFASSREVFDSPNPVFDEVVENFVLESPKVLNSALYDQVNISGRYQDFVSEFIDYSKSKKLDLGIFYVIKGDNIFLSNNIDSNITIIDNPSYVIQQNNNLSLSSKSFITFSYDNLNYSFNFSTLPLEVIYWLVVQKELFN